MQEHAKAFEVKVLARVLEVSASGYYAWRKQSQAKQNDADDGHQINRKRVQRILQEQGWVVKAKRRTA